MGTLLFEKWGTLLFAKSRLKKNGSFFIQKEKRQGCLFSFLITMTLFFCTLLLKAGCLIFFSGSQTDPCFQNKNSGFTLTGRLSLQFCHSFKKFRGFLRCFCLFTTNWVHCHSPIIWIILANACSFRTQTLQKTSKCGGFPLLAKGKL